MILESLANADRYQHLHRHFPSAFAFLRSSDLASLPQGRHDIMGDEVFAIVSRANGRTRDESPLECHRRYLDIQYVISGRDEMGWKPSRNCVLPRGQYSQEKDILFFDDRPDSWVLTPSGSFCIFFPEDAHAPLVSDGLIHKVVVKIAV